MKVDFGNATQLRLVTLDRCQEVSNFRAFPDPCAESPSHRASD